MMMMIVIMTIMTIVGKISIIVKIITDERERKTGR